MEANTEFPKLEVFFYYLFFHFFFFFKTTLLKAIICGFAGVGCACNFKTPESKFGKKKKKSQWPANLCSVPCGVTGLRPDVDVNS